MVVCGQHFSTAALQFRVKAEGCRTSSAVKSSLPSPRLARMKSPYADSSRLWRSRVSRNSSCAYDGTWSSGRFEMTWSRRNPPGRAMSDALPAWSHERQSPVVELTDCCRRKIARTHVLVEDLARVRQRLRLGALLRVLDDGEEDVARHVRALLAQVVHLGGQQRRVVLSRRARRRGAARHVGGQLGLTAEAQSTAATAGGSSSGGGGCKYVSAGELGSDPSYGCRTLSGAGAPPFTACVLILEVEGHVY